MQSFAPAVNQFKDTWTGLNDESPQEILTEPLVPPRKGVRSATCLGRVLSMHGKYGWIQPLQQIDHKDTALHEGRIYLKAKDMRCGEVPRINAIVEFYLYCDRSGLGAEDCHVVSSPTCNTDTRQSQREPWQKSWKSWDQNWEPHWQKSQQWSAEKWETKPTRSWNLPVQRRPEPLIMVRPELLLGVESSSAASLRSFEPSQWEKAGTPEKMWCTYSEDDSTSAGDSGSDVGELPDIAMLGPPPGLEDCLRIPPPPGLELMA